mmetsp:Transcript_19678/g.63954  ORF Transcript_19678/g.63954 Transcript_19678/m.63954 type:complete len:220 (-) Transcript_19678:3015-3674(-)
MEIAKGAEVGAFGPRAPLCLHALEDVRLDERNDANNVLEVRRHVILAVKERQLVRRLVGIRFAVDIGALVGQETHHLEVAGCGSDVESGVLVLPHRIDKDAVLRDHLANHLEVAAFRRPAHLLLERLDERRVFAPAFPRVGPLEVAAERLTTSRFALPTHGAVTPLQIVEFLLHASYALQSLALSVRVPERLCDVQMHHVHSARLVEIFLLEHELAQVA